MGGSSDRGRTSPAAAGETLRLRRALRDLEVLEEIASSTSAEHSLESIFQTIVERCVARMSAEQGALHLFENHKQQEAARTLLRSSGTGEDLPFRLDAQLLGYMLKYRHPLRLYADAPNDGGKGVRGLLRSGVKSLLVVPLRSKGDLLGVLTLVNKRQAGGFSPEDERVMTIVAAHSAQVIETAILVGELRRDKSGLEQEKANLLRQVRDRFSDLGIIGTTAKFVEIFQLIEQVRDACVDVLVTGESGSGKELIGKAIHYTSNRSQGPFVALNCAALPKDLLEAELFGIERGVATGVERRIGQFEAANQGTLFLDEIGDLAPAAQAKILRALQERQIQRVGGREAIPVDVRVVAATNKDLENEVSEGRFRDDLFYRLNVIRIRIPPLRERRQDIPLLAERFAEKACQSFGKQLVRFTPAALAVLAAAPWPGNIRELENEVKRAVLCSRGDFIEPESLSVFAGPAAAFPEASNEGGSLEEAMAAFERRLLTDALQTHGGNQAAAARALGVSRPGLFKKLKRHGLQAKSIGHDRN